MSYTCWVNDFFFPDILIKTYIFSIKQIMIFIKSLKNCFYVFFKFKRGVLRNKMQKNIRKKINKICVFWPFSQHFWLTSDSANDGGLHRKIVFITLEIFLLMRQPVVFQLFLSSMSGCYILLFFIYIYIYMYISE